MTPIHFFAFSLGLCTAWISPAAAFTEMNEYKKGQVVAGYHVESLYVDAEGSAMGARFLHSNGMTVDVLRFASVPQISLNVGSLPPSNMGEPHTQEHLLLGKGKTGQYLNSMMSMSLGDHTAATYTELTNYQFNTAADKETFYRLLKSYLTGIFKPDYTDEEIRREVAHVGTTRDPKTGRIHLEEKGTVYLEMVSTMEKAQSVNWHQLNAYLFGKDNPLARSSGGLPADIRKMTPEDIRRFHAQNYHFGSNVEIVASLPPNYSPEEFLTRLSAAMEEIEPEALNAQPGCRPGNGACERYASLPAFSPAKNAPIVIGRFPSGNAELPQSVIYAWAPLKKAPTPREKMELTLFLSVLADGDASVLYRALIDKKTRGFDSGATNIGSYFDKDPANVPMLFFSGMKVERLNEEHLKKLRETILSEIQDIRKAGRDSKELASFNAKALSLLSSWRRSTLKFIDSPPRFGFRGTGIGWHQALKSHAITEEFRKDMTQAGMYDSLEKDLRKNGNIWKNVIRKAKLEKPMIVSAVKPDKKLLESERSEKTARLTKAAEGLKKRFSATEADAFSQYEAEFAKASAVLKERDSTIARPRFVDAPPLTLDETIDAEVSRVAGSVPIVVSRFPSTPFTDLYLYFDLRGVSIRDRVYLPVLPSLLTDLGVTAADGTSLDYVRMREKWRSEIYGLSAGTVANPKTGRLELSVTASGAGSAEIPKAAEWLEAVVLRSHVTAATAERLRAVVYEEIQALRGLFQGREENWVHEAANAYLYQKDPLWMTLKSPFTRLQSLNRVYFRLAGYPDDKTKRLSETILADLAKDAKAGTYNKMKDRLSRLAAGSGLPPQLAASRFLKEFGTYFDAEFKRMPQESWRVDMERLIEQTQSDLAMDPKEAMKRLAKILNEVAVKAKLRMAITGSPAGSEAAKSALAELLKKLPAGEAGVDTQSKGRGVVFERLSERLQGLKTSPIHVGLVNNDTTSGVFVLSAEGPQYGKADEISAQKALAVQIFSGAGPHSFFIKTWSSGLAYSNGVRPSFSRGRIQYYAERCPDLTETMRFVSGLAQNTALESDFFIDYALANSFSDYRGAMTFSGRGRAMASDLADGQTPEKVRAFKAALMSAAKKPGALEAVRRQMPVILGSVLVGYGEAISQAPGALGFVIGPDRILDAYEEMLQSAGEADRLVRLFPRDFWIFD